MGVSENSAHRTETAASLKSLPVSATEMSETAVRATL